MADLIVNYSRTIFATIPVANGSSSRTEAIAIGASSAPGQLVAAAGEEFVDLLAGADCWVVIGATPVAAAIASGATGSGRKLLSGERGQFSVSVGDKVAVIQG